MRDQSIHAIVMLLDWSLTNIYGKTQKDLSPICESMQFIGFKKKNDR